jgi:hypothetical protein
MRCFRIAGVRPVVPAGSFEVVEVWTDPVEKRARLMTRFDGLPCFMLEVEGFIGETASAARRLGRRRARGRTLESMLITAGT